MLRFLTDPNALVSFLLMIPCALLSLSVHEFAHGYVSYRLGDPTAKNFGRLTLNPVKHIDLLGTICMVLFRFGWAKPVPVNSRYYKKPRRDMALVAAAGPISNLLMAFLGLLILYLSYLIYANVAAEPISFFELTYRFAYTMPPETEAFAPKLMYILFTLFYQFSILNVSLAVFNLIPVPPLDGSRIAYVFLPPKLYFGIMRYERYIVIGLIVLAYLGAFTGVISSVAGFLLGGMEKLLRLLPFFRF